MGETSQPGVTYGDIDRLRDDAAGAGDKDLVALCRVALAVDRGDVLAAQEQVASIIRERRARG